MDLLQHIYILGFPVKHSLSPIMHNAAFAALRLNYEYSLQEVSPKQLGDFVTNLRQDNCRGANVTIPHKETVIPFLDDLSPAAQAIGAVNTIVHQGGRLKGHNTDHEGFLEPLKELVDLQDKRVLIYGAGGAARAAVYALLQEGVASIHMVARTPERAEKIMEEMASYNKGSHCSVGDTMDGVVADTDILINASPVGMHFEDPLWLDPKDMLHKICYDLIYTPQWTQFLRLGQMNGCEIIFGYKMLVGQAYRAFELWTGAVAPEILMEEALLKQLEQLR